jgi:hypothetical protein
VTPIDVGLSRRFDERVGRHPVVDLATDFRLLVLERTGDGRVPRPSTPSAKSPSMSA